MTVTNRDVKQASRQIFASSRAIVTPFFNREGSRKEMREILTHAREYRGAAVIVSAPMGTGKTFLIEQIGNEIGIVGRDKPLLVREATPGELRRERKEVVFIDEGDIKSPWDELQRGISIIGQYLGNSGRVGLVLGDLVLRNPQLLAELPNHRFLHSFEPIDREFLEGVIGQRVWEYLHARKGEEIIEPDLYDVLAPAGLAAVNSFRAILTFLEELTRTLPHNTEPCRLTREIATQYAANSLDPLIIEDRQEVFLNRFLDYLAVNHPRGSGLENGFGQSDMYVLAQEAGYEDWEAFRDEIIEPLGEQGLLLSGGIPAVDAKGQFLRWVEPFYPSLRLMLVAGA